MTTRSQKDYDAAKARHDRARKALKAAQAEVASAQRALHEADRKLLEERLRAELAEKEGG